MHILQAVPALGSGGVETGTVDVANYLVENGHQATIVSGGGPQQQRLHKDVKHHKLPIGAKSLKAVSAVSKLRSIIAEAKPDIVQWHSRVPGYVCKWALSKVAKTNRPVTISHFHGFYSKPWYSKIMAQGDVVLSVSDVLADHISEVYRIDRADIEVIPPGLTSKFDAEHSLSTYRREQLHQRCEIQPVQLILLLPGRITRWKGQTQFIKLIAALKQREVPVPVVGLCVGDVKKGKEKYLHKLKKQAKKLGVESSVRWVGHSEKLQDYMGLADIILNLSTDREAFGRVVAEGVAMNKPVVAWNHGGAGEILSAAWPEGLVDLNDERALLDKVLEIWNGKLTAENVKTDLYGTESTMRHFIELYQRVLARKI